jgi:hypothetical protein
VGFVKDGLLEELELILINYGKNTLKVNKLIYNYLKNTMSLPKQFKEN